MHPRHLRRKLLRFLRRGKFIIAYIILVTMIILTTDSLYSRSPQQDDLAAMVMPTLRPIFAREDFVEKIVKTIESPSQQWSVQNPCKTTSSAITSKESKTKNGYEYQDQGISSTSSQCVTKSLHSMLSFGENSDRLENQMFSYAILFALANVNNRTAFMPPKMSDKLSKRFKVSLKTLDTNLYRSTKWRTKRISGKVQGSPENWNLIPKSNSLVKLVGSGSKQSWKYLGEMHSSISAEFRIHDHIVKKAKTNVFRNCREQLSSEICMNSTTNFVGVFLIRNDQNGGRDTKKKSTKKSASKIQSWKSEVSEANSKFGYHYKALKYFQDKYLTPVFILLTDDISWSRKNFAKLLGMHYRIVYVDLAQLRYGQPEGFDWAILPACDHIILGKKFGATEFWTGYLNQGEVVYCSDCLVKSKKEVTWQNQGLIDHIKFVPSTWVGISKLGT